MLRAVTPESQDKLCAAIWNKRRGEAEVLHYDGREAGQDCRSWQGGLCNTEVANAIVGEDAAQQVGSKR